MVGVGEIFRFRCRLCLQETNHRALFDTRLVKSYPYDDQQVEQYGISYEEVDEYTMLQCCGCDDIRLVLTHITEYLENQHSTTQVYPPDLVRHMPEWVHMSLYAGPNLRGQPVERPGLRDHFVEIRALLREIYQALGSGSRRLAMMGIRALIERIMIFEVSDRHRFEKNISAFEERYVAPNQREMFRRALIEAGHAAMHRGWEPKHEDVMTLLDITETMIKSIYVDEDKAKALATKITPRVPPIRKKK